ncbi:predicted protein [Sclerotinia sclerotiorum 1980 UF-70]|uniref:Uncharacterized protein n=1 Tax=Sclerotinia sclerotiorum (strain ATCC 18683 / 1980 / Ss-1) TaxID=665079 RepID=A7F368_SCLS1|nr:predicted protein [Sclerotinia sclerotiorum 1980 UF-70]EDN97189.1 predicted protein [Sclerotinia sclerotiorum 1980 UF-70]
MISPGKESGDIGRSQQITGQSLAPKPQHQFSGVLLAADTSLGEGGNAHNIQLLCGLVLK